MTHPDLLRAARALALASDDFTKALERGVEERTLLGGAFDDMKGEDAERFVHWLRALEQSAKAQADTARAEEGEGARLFHVGRAAAYGFLAGHIETRAQLDMPIATSADMPAVYPAAAAEPPARRVNVVLVRGLTKDTTLVAQAIAAAADCVVKREHAEALFKKRGPQGEADEDWYAAHLAADEAWTTMRDALKKCGALPEEAAPEAPDPTTAAAAPDSALQGSDPAASGPASSEESSTDDDADIPF